MTLDEFNALSDDELHAALARCCVCERWIAPVAAGRPYASREALLAVGEAVWAQLLEPVLMEPYLLEAFAGHPKIGDLDSLRERYSGGRELAAAEQAGVADADEALLQRLAEGNRAYEERFGFIFIICASGRSAEEMCEALEQRLRNDRETELAVAGAEQGKILRLRLEQLV
jgi:2-oxo-4-hydroxy-4-carboxy-5-ureidoimidazoline decarboxylase